jgi:hypothetical protein
VHQNNNCRRFLRAKLNERTFDRQLRGKGATIVRSIGVGLAEKVAHPILHETTWHPCYQHDHTGTARQIAPIDGTISPRSRRNSVSPCTTEQNITQYMSQTRLTFIALLTRAKGVHRMRETLSEKRAFYQSYKGRFLSASKAAQHSFYPKAATSIFAT